MCVKGKGNIEEPLFDSNGKQLTEKEARELEEIRKIQKRINALKNCEFICAAAMLLCIFISLTVVMVFIIDNKLSDYKKAAEIISTYTSIVLGFVAMTVSLIGMVLSFHNTKQAEESNLNTTKEFLNLSYSVGNLRDLEKGLEETLGKVSSKIDSLEGQMRDFEKLENQLVIIQESIKNLTKDLQVSVDRRKGTETVGVHTLVVNPSQVEKDMKSDEGET